MIIVAGNAGVGKDTFASFLKDRYTAIAQADLIKRLARSAFGIDPAYLWGPSHLRESEIPLGFPHNGCVIAAEVLNEISLFGGFSPEALLALLNAETKDKPITVRRVLQIMGTEWGRAVDQDIWSRFAMLDAMEIFRGGRHYSPQLGILRNDFEDPMSGVIITDCRFQSERDYFFRVKSNNHHLAELEILCVRIDASNRVNKLSGAAGTHASEPDFSTWEDWHVIENNGSLEEFKAKVLAL